MSWTGGQMDEDMALALAISMSMEGGGGFDSEPRFSSSSQDPRSGHAVDVESKLLKEYISTSGHKIQVRCGDMTKEKVDVIVNAANKHLDHASGLAGAIVKKGGEIIQMESDIWISENGKVGDGDIAITGAGELPAKKIVHAVGPIWHGGEELEMLTLRSCVWESFKKTEELGYKSISVPAISSGIFRFPKDLCAEIIFETALDWFKGNPKNLHEIRFTNFDQDTVNFFTKEFVKRFDKENSGKETIVESTPVATSPAATSTSVPSPTTTDSSVVAPTDSSVVAPTESSVPEPTDSSGQ
eukprot:TRINITY_DN2100_c0_g1_i1.p1 TRINITY_DN2100_c0_g1~~TRINITY_DN2100_c0_g1_i1.p1  ORF type:complete len:331 (-),score=80.88 TRINITY_DN2100_c0_g1_i1:127-1023(-)